jgi:maltooligosyltrehalose trehalohydrolase
VRNSRSPAPDCSSRTVETLDPHALRLGAQFLGGDRCSFLAWAPEAQMLDVRLISQGQERFIRLKRLSRGYHGAVVEGVFPGDTYLFRLNGEMERPDPASRYQPQGVHEASEIVDPTFVWGDRTWFGLPLRHYIIYELHVGTFTGEGTFDGVVSQLTELKELGVTALELMPVAQFPGRRNWGYDGVFPFAVQNSYGGPAGLKRLVNAAHQAGLAVVLDVVYNHLGPEGNHLADFGPYFTDRYRTPWGLALNFDGEHSDEVRRFFIENALYWQSEFHIDALRLDAVHAIKDTSAYPFLEELADRTHRKAEELNRRFHLIAESDLNHARLISPKPAGGCGLDAQWSDDFHHCLHVLLTGEQDGYYADYQAVPALLARVFRQGYAYTGQYSSFRKRRHGQRADLSSPGQFVVFSQNHDQVGNRRQGDRLSRLADLESLKLSAAAVLLSPFIPLLFMGEEYGETAPFQYVTSHTDPEVVEAVRQGRREEFSSFAWKGEAPDPQAEETFQDCILNRGLCRLQSAHGALFGFYQELIRLREAVPAITQARKEDIKPRAFEAERALQVVYHSDTPSACLVLCFSEKPVCISLEGIAGDWTKLLDSAASTWGGSGSQIPDRFSCTQGFAFDFNPRSVVLFQKLGNS